MKTNARTRSALTVLAVLAALSFSNVPGASAQALPGGSLNPKSIPQFVEPLTIPGVMAPSSSTKKLDYYEIAVRQFQQQILPAQDFQGIPKQPFPKTTVWSYGTVDPEGAFNYPAFSIEAKAGKPVRVKWINQLVDANGNYLPHLLPVDQTLHWANPPGPRDSMGNMDPTPYTGPVPVVVHLHGAHVDPDSDGYPEAWWLPAAGNIDCKDEIDYPKTSDTADDFYCHGSKYGQVPGARDVLGQALYEYRNDQRATALWFHDHSLGMTRTNVYAGPAGFYFIRGGASDLPSGGPGELPGGKYEIPLVIQDRSFNLDGSLFYPGSRFFFDLFAGPYIPDPTIDGPDSDVHPIWNPEFFGNTMVVNGKTWPFLNVEPRKYRFRILNGSDSRFLVLAFNNMNLKFTVIGTEGGFLPAPVVLKELLIGPAERFDVIVDFSKFKRGDQIILANNGPDVPFGGFPIPIADMADPATTGKVMMFKVVALTEPDTSVIPALPAITNLVPTPGIFARKVSLNELESRTVCVDAANIAVSCASPGAVPLAPLAAQLGTVEGGMPMPMAWMDAISETPNMNTTEVWEIHNFTVDAHPIHVHQTMFQVTERQAMVMDPLTGMPAMPVQLAGSPRGPEVWESGFKDTVIAYPGEVTRIKALFDIAGLYVWHCHILSHEDNEMMRPFCVGGRCP
jgi:spore coat protein A, manganese oxidase